jgi:hypothetical protein
MAGLSIYPSIPAPGTDLPSLQAALSAMRQTLTMVIINAQNPDPNYTPSSAAQVFITNARLQKLGVISSPNQLGSQGATPMSARQAAAMVGIINRSRRGRR